MRLAITDDLPQVPRVLYDGNCSFCRACVRLIERPLFRRGFVFTTLQSEIGRTLAGGSTQEMKVITPDGRIRGGAEGVAYVARFIWWAFPLPLLWCLPFVRPLLRAAYRFVARHCGCSSGECSL